LIIHPDKSIKKPSKKEGLIYKQSSKRLVS
jgi:hypothetical protein